MKYHNFGPYYEACLVAHSPEHGGQCMRCTICNLFIAPKEFKSECTAAGMCGDFQEKERAEEKTFQKALEEGKKGEC